MSSCCFVVSLSLSRSLSLTHTHTRAPKKGDIMRSVEEKFQISVDKVEINFVFVESGRELIEASSYPSFTMFGQSLGGARFILSALRDRPLPDLFFDTTGCAFTFLPVKLLSFLRGRRVKVFTYTHYPTISTDMLKLVYERRFSYNNSRAIAGSRLKNFAKLVYYCIFALCYCVSGRFADFVMVNSTWTQGHIRSLWRGSPTVLYPPCDAKGFSASSLAGRKNYVLSIGQFRPEKDHQLQIRAFKLFKEGGGMPKGTKLVLLGGCRGPDDEARVFELRKLVNDLELTDDVIFLLNEPYKVLKSYLSESSVGIHTMWNEHFGIGVVEMMAAGLVTIAHNSGGPKADIIKVGASLPPPRAFVFLFCTFVFLFCTFVFLFCAFVFLFCAFVFLFCAFVFLFCVFLA